MPNNESINKGSVAMGAVELAILYFLSYFLNLLLSYISKIGLMFSLFIVPVFLGLCHVLLYLATVLQ